MKKILPFVFALIFVTYFFYKQTTFAQINLLNNNAANNSTCNSIIPPLFSSAKLNIQTLKLLTVRITEILDAVQTFYSSQQTNEIDQSIYDKMFVTTQYYKNLTNSQTKQFEDSLTQFKCVNKPSAVGVKALESSLIKTVSTYDEYRLTVKDLIDTIKNNSSIQATTSATITPTQQ